MDDRDRLIIVVKEVGDLAESDDEVVFVLEIPRGEMQREEDDYELPADSLRSRQNKYLKILTRRE